MADSNDWTGGDGGTPPGDGGGAPPPGGVPPGDGGGAAPAAGGNAPPAAGGDWRTALPENIRQDPSMVKFGSVEALAQSYLHAQALIGKKGIIPPGPQASPEERAAFYEQLGRPKDLNGYELKATGLPEGVKISEAVTAGFKGKAHELGLTAEQAANLFEWYSGQIGDTVRTQMAAKGEAPKKFEAFLAQTYGLANIPTETQKAKSVVMAFADEEIMQGLQESGAQYQPWFFKLMNKVGGKFGEGSLQGGGTMSFAPTPAQATTELNAIMSNKEDPYWQPQHPDNKARVQQALRLQEILANTPT